MNDVIQAENSSPKLMHKENKANGTLYRGGPPASFFVEIAQVTVSSEFQMRVKSDPATLAEYVELIRVNEKTWPFSTPCTVYIVDRKVILTDGFHRMEAMRMEGRTQILVSLHVGTRLDALKSSLGANAGHGLRRSNADKRRSVTVALQDETLQKWSDRQLAELCGVSQPFVGDLRGAMITVISSEVETRIGRDGKHRPANSTAARENRARAAKLITKNPEASNATVAKEAGCNDKTVAAVRREMKARVDQDDPQETECVPIEPDTQVSISEHIHVELQRLLRMIVGIDPNSEDAKKILGYVKQFNKDIVWSPRRQDTSRAASVSVPIEL
jgi:hypothetical protein